MYGSFTDSTNAQLSQRIVDMHGSFADMYGSFVDMYGSFTNSTNAQLSQWIAQRET